METVSYESIEFLAYLAFHATDQEFRVCYARLREHKTLAEVADQFGITRERVRQIEHGAKMAATRLHREGVV